MEDLLKLNYLDEICKLCGMEQAAYFCAFAWQPRFHDHIIRHNDELILIREYIENNPKNWANDDLRCKNGNLGGSILEHTTREQL